MDLNAKMFNTNLNGKTSAMVKTEVQEIEIMSTIVPETTVLKIFNCYYFLKHLNFFVDYKLHVNPSRKWHCRNSIFENNASNYGRFCVKF
jgi:hypothetical protein